MSSPFAIANELAILQVGRNPQWVQFATPHTTLLGAPDSANSGVYLQDSPTTMLLVRLRADPSKRTALVTVDTFDATDTYTLTINGAAIVASTTPTDVDDLLVDAKAAILADATVGGGAGANQVVTARCLDADGTATDGTAAGGNAAVTLEVTGTVEADFSIAESTAGSGDLDVSADASACGLRGWGTPRVVGSQTAASGWAHFIDRRGKPMERGLTYRGLMDRLNTAAVDRLYPELHSIIGVYGDDANITLTVAQVSVGPCILEA